MVDCDDNDPTVYPGGPEFCNGEDDDCDGQIDENDALDASAWYLDYDQDGYGGAVLSTLACTQPQAYVANADDCDDTENSSYPGAPETCDGDDNDCDGSVDEADAVDGTDWYLDADGDGYGDASTTAAACSAPSGYVADDTDCDDNDAATWPGAEEFCDTVDTDCDGTVDEDDATDAITWYADFDADGHGNSTYTLEACDQPNGYVALDDDCDDLDAFSFPGGAEVCDLADNDCDGTADEDDALDATTWYADADGDGFGDAAVSHVSCLAPGGYVEDNTDCNDGEAAAWPGGEETWYDGIDGDCDGASDYDADGDGHDSDVHGGGDCDDTDPEFHPDAEDAWYDGIDTNCDGASDFDADGDGFDSASYEGDDCDDGNADTYPGAPDEPHDGVINDCNRTSDDDADGDGFDSVDYGGDDCDDANSAIHPEAEETWYDGVDDNCDGNDDDQDGDGYGVEEDCDDLDSTAYPGAPGWTEDCEPVPEDTGDTAGDTGGDTGLESEQPKGGSRCATAPDGGFAGFGLVLLGAVLGRRRRVAG